jgi:gliding motility-associated-like protein
MKKTLLTFILLKFLFSPIKAEHLAGGDLFYECVGNNNFRITLYHYRDCNPGSLTPDNDDPDAIIFVQDLDNLGSGLRAFQFFKSEAITIPNNDLGPCLQNPEPVCINRATYTGIINLPRNIRGYRIINQRCCRNNGIISIPNPSITGSTYELFISGLATNDCTPANASFSFSFDEFPPSQLCNQVEVTTDQSATATNADQVRYQLCSPYDGASIDDPFPYSPYIYRNVGFTFGFSATQPIGPTSETFLNTNTGQLRVKPSRQGRFIVGICADAYKGGNLYASIRRDFQFNIFSCDGPVAKTDQNSYISCNDYSVAFTSTSSGAQSFFWDFDGDNPGVLTSTERNPTFVFPDTGSYTVIHTINPGLVCSSTVTVPVSVYPFHSVDFEFEEACVNEELVFRDISSSTNNDIISSFWSLGDGTTSNLKQLTKQYNQPGTYTVSLTSETLKGCINTRRKQVVVYKLPDINFDNKGFCIESATTISNSTPATENVNSYSWFLNDNLISNDVNPTLLISEPGTYSLKLSGINNLGCTNEIVKNIRVVDFMKANFDISSSEICSGQTTDFINLSEGEITAYNWSFGNGQSSNQENPSLEYNETGNYTVVLTVENGICPPDVISKSVLVRPTPIINIGGDREICGPNEEIIAFDNTNNYTLLWSTGETSNSTIITGEIGALSLTAELEGCFSTSQINIINRCNVYVPSAFAPNGVNKFFNVINKNIDRYTLTLFNRWGEIMFRTSDFGNGWDGTFKGEPMPMGNYGYSADIVDEAGKSFTKRGFFVLIR